MKSSFILLAAIVLAAQSVAARPNAANGDCGFATLNCVRNTKNCGVTDQSLKVNGSCVNTIKISFIHNFKCNILHPICCGINKCKATETAQIPPRVPTLPVPAPSAPTVGPVKQPTPVTTSTPVLPVPTPSTPIVTPPANENCGSVVLGCFRDTVKCGTLEQPLKVNGVCVDTIQVSATHKLKCAALHPICCGLNKCKVTEISRTPRRVPTLPVPAPSVPTVEPVKQPTPVTTTTPVVTCPSANADCGSVVLGCFRDTVKCGTLEQPLKVNGVCVDTIQVSATHKLKCAALHPICCGLNKCKVTEISRTPRRVPTLPVPAPSVPTVEPVKQPTPVTTSTPIVTPPANADCGSVVLGCFRDTVKCGTLEQPLKVNGVCVDTIQVSATHKLKCAALHPICCGLNKCKVTEISRTPRRVPTLPVPAPSVPTVGPVKQPTPVTTSTPVLPVPTPSTPIVTPPANENCGSVVLGCFRDTVKCGTLEQPLKVNGVCVDTIQVSATHKLKCAALHPICCGLNKCKVTEISRTPRRVPTLPVPAPSVPTVEPVKQPTPVTTSTPIVTPPANENCGSVVLGCFRDTVKCGTLEQPLKVNGVCVDTIQVSATHKLKCAALHPICCGLNKCKVTEISRTPRRVPTLPVPAPSVPTVGPVKQPTPVTTSTPVLPVPTPSTPIVTPPANENCGSVVLGCFRDTVKCGTLEQPLKVNGVCVDTIQVSATHKLKCAALHPICCGLNKCKVTEISRTPRRVPTLPVPAPSAPTVGPVKQPTPVTTSTPVLPVPTPSTPIVTPPANENCGSVVLGCFRDTVKCGTLEQPLKVNGVCVDTIQVSATHKLKCAALHPICCGLNKCKVTEISRTPRRVPTLPVPAPSAPTVEPVKQPTPVTTSTPVLPVPTPSTPVVTCPSANADCGSVVLGCFRNTVKCGVLEQPLKVNGICVDALQVNAIHNLGCAALHPICCGLNRCTATEISRTPPRASV
ncbi:hypothetical protein BDF19DRAFT_485554 [Syncephalis fuscata]|nr:hypothetical protein BDF19DRAFT_485554 [Syncephalis fuscata]